MAASDATYRNIKALHVVFAVSSIVMLLTIVGMFAKDYFRDWKVEQRLFYDVEEEMAKRAVLAAAPTEEDVKKITELETSLREKKAALAKARSEMEKGLGDLPARKLKKEKEQADVKASVDSMKSFIDQTAESREEGLQSEKAQRQREELEKLQARLAEVTREVQENQEAYNKAAHEAGLPKLEQEIAADEKDHKTLLGDFDRFIKLASQKRWSAAESIRTLPIIDAFASPTKIQQYTLNDLPIDYSFKYVTRYDRCTTCHMGMEKAAYDVPALAKLADDPLRDKELQTRLKGAQAILKARSNAGVKDLPKESAIEPRQIPGDRLTAGRVKQFAAHPRLDLFVDANSPHPGEKFGCTICHSGQGSATAFFEASHSPNNAKQTKDWAESHGWQSNHFWDYPMLPARFVESSCLKCHHDVTDLIREGNKAEAPKLLKGYNLVKELGCFGCHEISGIKSGNKIGPDLRLEPETPLESLTPAERAKALSDPLNPPGEMRKVGPNLKRLAEKTNEEWVRLWLKSPRGFRETTKMPHFYLQPNNRPAELPLEQKKFPDNEIHAVAHYLMTKSKVEIDRLKRFANEKPEVRTADVGQEGKLKQQIFDLDKQLSDPKAKEREKLQVQLGQLKKDLKDVQDRISERNAVLALAAPTALQKLPLSADANRGRMLFQERGCLACHSHQATETPGPEVGGKKIPPITGDATFAPDLSRLAHKIKPQGGAADDGRKWVVSWLLNPASHNPRTYMPDTQLTIEQANDIASWLLSQNVKWELSDEQQVEAVDLKTLTDMAELYLKKVLTIGEVHEVLKRDSRGVAAGGFTVGRLKEFQKANAGADELELGGDFTGKKDNDIVPIDEHKLKMYVGKKGIGNLGCYACHSVPGFQGQNAKPIGTALNEWGKKDAERLAFEDAHKFVEHHFNVVPTRDDPKDPKKAAADYVVGKDGKKPYEQYFFDRIDHHGRTREGFLHLKLEEPRSYDYNRLRSWDDRLRMPQFKFARPRRLPDETREQYEARTIREEAEAREAVMTFILGLVAETIPARYVNAPTGDRLHEVKGRQVLDKFNCAGCHLIRPGTTEFKPGNIFPKLEDHPETYKHEGRYTKDDYNDPNHISWSGRDQFPYERVRVQGTGAPLEVKEDEDEATQNVRVWLLQALRFRAGGKKDAPLRDISAGAMISLPPGDVTGTAAQFGGSFMEKLVPYLQKKDRDTFGGGGAKLSLAYASVPPTLVGEGEKVQPEWLYKFLRNPHVIRPLTVLRMPKFNMSSEDAQALVNYFAAVDRRENVGIGLTYPYVPMPQREEAYLQQKTAEYVARLKGSNQYDARKKDLEKFWEAELAAQRADADRRVKDVQESFDKTPEAGKEEAKKLLDAAKKKATEAAERVSKKDVADLVKRWEEREAYVADASRLVVHANLCLTCHSAGGEPGKENKDPLLDNVGDRLRPDWTKRWITNPNRFLHYSSVMPINFLSTKTDHQDAFVGSSLDQIDAVRDFLMLYPQVRDWPVLRARPMLGIGAAPMPAAGGK